jgi:predicted secreted protein
MAKVNGSELLIEYDGSVIAHQREHSISFEAEQIDSTDKEEAWQVSIKGRKSGSNDIELVLNTDGEYNVEELFTLLKNDNAVKGKIPLNSGGTQWLEGDLKLYSLELSFPDQDVAVVSGTAQTEGSWTYVTS